jgi:hypothetical protein
MRVRLRRQHPCGGDVFLVTAVGADIRLQCEKCSAKVFLERQRWPTRVREVLDADAAHDD